MTREQTRHYACFSHKECEFYPCHAGADPEHFNCLFCYCPLYLLGSSCGGGFVMLENGVKDCSHCVYPHDPAHYDEIIRRLSRVSRYKEHTP